MTLASATLTGAVLISTLLRPICSAVTIASMEAATCLVAIDAPGVQARRQHERTRATGWAGDGKCQHALESVIHRTRWHGCMHLGRAAWPARAAGSGTRPDAAAPAASPPSPHQPHSPRAALHNEQLCDGRSRPTAMRDQQLLRARGGEAGRAGCAHQRCGGPGHCAQHVLLGGLHRSHITSHRHGGVCKRRRGCRRAQARP